MTLEKMEELFESGVFLQFEDIPEQRRLSNRPDLNAFILLNQLVPETRDLISAAEHDEFYLSTPVELLAAVATEEQILDLNRCGVRFDSEFECLTMFA